MGRKELSKLSKETGAARIDSSYYRDTCEAFGADPSAGLGIDHFSQLYLDGRACLGRSILCCR